jgi:hypothetical protein
MSDTGFKYQPVLNRPDLKKFSWALHKFVRDFADCSKINFALDSGLLFAAVQNLPVQMKPFYNSGLCICADKDHSFRSLFFRSLGRYFFGVWVEIQRCCLCLKIRKSLVRSLAGLQYEHPGAPAIWSAGDVPGAPERRGISAHAPRRTFLGAPGRGAHLRQRGSGRAPFR